MHEQPAVAPAYDLGHYLRPLHRHRSLLVTFAVIGLVLGAAYALLSHPTYTSATSVNVSALPTLPGQATAVNAVGSRTNGQVNLDTEAQLVKSSTVLARARTALHTTMSVGALRSRVGVTVPPNSTILQIACTGHSARSAQECSSAVAAAYLGNRSDQEIAAINQQVAATRRQIAAIDRQIHRDTASYLSAPAGSQARTIAYTLRQSDINDRNSLNDQINQLTTADTTPGTVISPASSGSTSVIKRAIPPLMGIVIGLIVGAGAVGWRERHGRFVTNADDLARHGVPVVADLATEAGSHSRLTSRAAKIRFEQRVASLVAGAFDTGGGVVYVAPVSPNQATGNIARSLAATLASVGHQVEVFWPHDDVAEASAQTRQAERAASATVRREDAGAGAETEAADLGWPGADLHPAAPNGSGPAAEPEPEPPVPDPIPMTIRQQLELCRRRAQFVIIDADPAVTDPQAYVLTGLSDIALLVIDPEGSRRTDLAEVVDQINVSGTELLGAVIWRRRRSALALARPRKTVGDHRSTTPPAPVRPAGPSAGEPLPAREVASSRAVDAGR